LSRSALEDPWLGYVGLWFVTQLLFFTFTRNIVATYVAPALPAFALIAAHVLQRSGLHRRATALAAVALVTPLLSLAMIVMQALYPDSRFVSTQANIVKQYEALSRGSAGQLVYVINHPYSGGFYTKGEAIFGHHLEELRPAARIPDTYFVVPAHRIYRIAGDVWAQLTVVGHANGFLLVQPSTQKQRRHQPGFLAPGRKHAT
jgi:hypothetical protein